MSWRNDIRYIVAVLFCTYMHLWRCASTHQLQHGCSRNDRAYLTLHQVNFIPIKRAESQVQCCMYTCTIHTRRKIFICLSAEIFQSVPQVSSKMQDIGISYKYLLPKMSLTLASFRGKATGFHCFIPWITFTIVQKKSQTLGLPSTVMLGSGISRETKGSADSFQLPLNMLEK